MHLSMGATFSVVLVTETHGMILKDIRVLSMRVWPSQPRRHPYVLSTRTSQPRHHPSLVVPDRCFRRALGPRRQGFLCSHSAFLGTPLLEGRTGHEPWPSEALHKAAWEEARAAIPLQSPLEPAIFMLLVYEDNVTFL